MARGRNRESGEEELLKLARSVKKPTRLKVAKNPNATARVLIGLMDDSDKEIARTAAAHPNIDKLCFQILIDPVDGLAGVHADTYRAFFKNVNFQKDWLKKYLEHMEYAGHYTIPMLALEDERFFSNDGEWIEVYEIVKKVSRRTSGSAWGTFWFSFFKYPQKNYSEEIILMILNDYGQAIKTNSPGTFTAIIDTPMITPSIKAKLFELTGDEDYLPDEAKDIFIF